MMFLSPVHSIAPSRLARPTRQWLAASAIAALMLCTACSTVATQPALDRPDHKLW